MFLSAKNCFQSAIPDGIMDTYCWIHSTFTLPKHINGDLGWEVAHPGVGPVMNYEEEVVEHKFYQWVAFVLFVQVTKRSKRSCERDLITLKGLCFLVPYQIWKVWEGGRVARLIPQDDLCHTVHDSRMPG